MATELEVGAIPGEEVDPASVDWNGADFVWRSDQVRIAAFGAAIVIEASGRDSLGAKVSRELQSLGEAGRHAIAVGALPFDPTAHRRLVVPSVVYRRIPDGRTYCTRLDGPSLEFPDRPVPRNISSHDETQYKQLVANAIELLATSGMHKMAIARRFELTVDSPLDRSAVLDALDDRARQSFLFADGSFVGATPELLIRRQGNRGWSEPMAGTMPIREVADGNDLSSRMFSREKTHEHAPTPAHVSDVLSRYGEVTVHPTEARVYPTLAHLVTQVEVASDQDLPDALSLVEALHPTPAVGASPATDSMRVAEIEGFDRRLYAGPVGWVDANGNGEWAIALRCGEIGETNAILTAGNGITTMSEPHEEWLETESKLAVMVEAIESTIRRD